MSDLSQTLHELSWTGLMPVLLLTVLGLLLWAAGRKILRGAFAMIGFGLGGLLGLIVGESISLGVSSWIVALIGAVLLACVAALAYRVALAAAMMLIFALAAPLTAVAVAQFQANRAGHKLNEGEVTNPISDGITDWLSEHDDPAAREEATEALKSATSEKLDRAKDALETTFGEEGGRYFEKLQRFGEELNQWRRDQWEKTPQGLRSTLILASVTGGIIGLMLGILAPSLSAALVTAMGGSLLWLGGLRILALRLGVPDDAAWMPATGKSWLILWLITSFAGLAIQWTFRRRPADKPQH